MTLPSPALAAEVRSFYPLILFRAEKKMLSGVKSPGFPLPIYDTAEAVPFLRDRVLTQTLKPRSYAEPSNAHGHDHITILEIVGRIFPTHLACRRRVLKFQPHFAARSDGLKKVNQVGRIKTNYNRIEAVGSFDRILRLAQPRRDSQELTASKEQCTVRRRGRQACALASGSNALERRVPDHSTRWGRKRFHRQL